MRFQVLAPLTALILVVGCGASSQGPLAGSSIGEVVTNVVQAVNAGDTNRFTKLLDSQASAQVPQLFGMVQRSGIPTNYPSRLQFPSSGQARLNYHDLPRGCHFQIDLQKDVAGWRVTRIWFCR